MRRAERSFEVFGRSGHGSRAALAAAPKPTALFVAQRDALRSALQRQA
jgi:hypothetical protein